MKHSRSLNAVSRRTLTERVALRLLRGEDPVLIRSFSPTLRRDEALRQNLKIAFDALIALLPPGDIFAPGGVFVSETELDVLEDLAIVQKDIEGWQNGRSDMPRARALTACSALLLNAGVVMPYRASTRASQWRLLGGG